LAELLQEKGYVVVTTMSDADIIVNITYGINNDCLKHDLIRPDSIIKDTLNTKADIQSRNDQLIDDSNKRLFEEQQIEYVRYVIIAAYKKSTEKKVEKPYEIWTTTIVSKGMNQNLDNIIPKMIASSKNYIGINKEILVSSNIIQ
jgi:hypothetical protein